MCFIFAVSNVHSQVLISLLFGDKLNSDKIEFGLETGVNFEQIEGFESNDRRAFFNIGFYFDFKLKNRDWSIYTGVLVKANQGLDNLTDNDLVFLGIDKQEVDDVIIEGSYKQVINAFMVPALLKYKFHQGVYLEGGMQFGWHTKAYVEFNSDNKDVQEQVRYKNNDAIQTNFILPVEGRFSSIFGLKRIYNKQKRIRRHTGLDIAAPQGTNIISPANGTVVRTGAYFFTGNTVFIDHKHKKVVIIAIEFQ